MWPADNKMEPRRKKVKLFNKRVEGPGSSNDETHKYVFFIKNEERYEPHELGDGAYRIQDVMVKVKKFDSSNQEIDELMVLNQEWKDPVH